MLPWSEPRPCSRRLIGLRGAESYFSLILGAYGGPFICAENVIIAIIGLARRESPRWPAVTGLALSVLTVLTAVYLLR